MATELFLAMTGAEISRSFSLPPKIGWMACHFSPYALGLSNLPTILPADSLLMVNDVTPIHGHDPEVIAQQLSSCVQRLQCSGVLLDFQRLENEETAALAAFLVKQLPCPVIVSEGYSANIDCPILLPPLPHHVPLEEYIAPWQGRDIWLEVAMDAEALLVTESGVAISSLLHSIPEGGYEDPALHCHYRMELSDNSARFTLWRTKEDIDTLLKEAEEKMITAAVGLYQEFR